MVFPPDRMTLEKLLPLLVVYHCLSVVVALVPTRHPLQVAVWLDLGTTAALGSLDI